MPRYKVQGCTILGHQVERAIQDTRVGGIQFNFQLTTSPSGQNKLAITVDAVNNPIPPATSIFTLDIFNYNVEDDLQLNNNWLSTPVTITRQMIDDVTKYDPVNGTRRRRIIFIRLRPQVYTYQGRDYIKFIVRIRLERFRRDTL